MIHPDRVSLLAPLPPDPNGDRVVYWMQQSQRAEWNHALEFAIRQANDMALPVVVVFALTDAYPEANERHYAFMLEGLAETAATLRARGIGFRLLRGDPTAVVPDAARGAAMLVMDRGYLRIQRQWRERIAARAGCRVVQVESDVVVPVEAAYPKEAYTAAVLRPKIHRLLGDHLRPLHPTPVRVAAPPALMGDPPPDADAVLARLHVDRSVGRVASFRGGRSAASALLDAFIATRLRHYAEKRNEPALDMVSHMSPYLHFGQISPLEIALRVGGGGADANVAAFLEEMIVRRELAVNFTHYSPDYDSMECLPAWAAATLEKHAADQRPHLYGREELERAATHDPYWNAAQTEMVRTGKMHNYMRMYWGKKILEWSATPAEAFGTALHLNNRHQLDGRDPNSFAGVAWCFGKHDRPWTERAIFGTVRYMNDAGLRRKFDMDAYVRRVAALADGPSR